MSVIFKHVSKYLCVWVLLISVNTAYAQDLSTDQIKHARAEIKALQKNHQYKEADTLIKIMLVKAPDNPLFYLDLALNYYYSGQPLQAEKALEYLMQNEEMANAPDQVKKNVSDFYKKIKLSADAHRAKQHNQSKLTYGVTLEVGFNNNVNLYPNNQNGIAQLDDEINLYNENELDPTIIGYFSETQHNLMGSTSVSLNYYSKHKKVNDSYLSLNHFVSATADVDRQEAQDMSASAMFIYKLQPKIKSANQTSWWDDHQYPLTFLYVAQSDSILSELQFNPSVNFFNNHGLGYQFKLTQSQYELTSIAQQTDEQLTTSYYYEFNAVESTIVTHGVYYQYIKQFTHKYTPTIFNKTTLSLASKSLEYTRVENETNVKLTLHEKVHFTQMYRFKYTDYNSDRESEFEHTLKSTFSFSINNNLKLDTQYQFKLRDSNDDLKKYNQSKYLFALKWAS